MMTQVDILNYLYNRRQQKKSIFLILCGKWLNGYGNSFKWQHCIAKIQKYNSPLANNDV